MLKYPFDEIFQAQQPLVVLEGSVLAKTGSPNAVAVLETAAGVHHPLSAIGSLESIWKMALRSSFSAIEAIVLHELPRQVAELRTDALTYFADYLVAAFQQREFSEDHYTAEPILAKRKEIDWTTEVAETARTIPPPEVEQPSLWIFGRVWCLRRRGKRSGCWRVHANDTSYSLSGDFSYISSLAAHWRRHVHVYLAKVACRLATQVGDLERTAQARRELAQYGAVERGDLVFIAGTPPLLAHIIPTHYNRTLSRTIRRELAVAAPLTLPPNPSRSSLAVYERRGRVWQAYRPPHGLCLGPDPPAHEQEAPGVGLAALLRWAAQRIAGNGIFHTSDDSNTTTYDDYQYQ